MLGIYFSGTGNSKYALEVFLREYDNNSVLFSIEDKSLMEYINSHRIIKTVGFLLIMFSFIVYSFSAFCRMCVGVSFYYIVPKI